jgi:biopolymer transport protein ExbD
MIDVVFLLIIFFLVASYFVRSEHSREVALPDAEKGNPDDPTSEYRLTITVERDGKLSIAGNIVSNDSVMQRIKELQASATAAASTGRKMARPEVRIRSDRDAQFVEIRKLIEQCAANGIHSIRFAVASQPK